MGVDLSEHSLDFPLEDIKTEGIHSLLAWVKAAIPDRAPVVRDIGVLASRSSRVSGTPEQIVATLCEWQDVGIDGTKWTAVGSVGHWGHIHTRQNVYDAILTLAVADGSWKITDIELLEEKRVDPYAPVSSTAR